MQNKVQAALRSKLDEAISVKRSQVETVSPWAFVAFFRYLAMVQVCEDSQLDTAIAIL